MTWHPTTAQRVDTSPNGWTAAAGPRAEPSPYLAETGFTMEDWNFARQDAIPNPLADDPTDAKPVLLGFGQGRVARRRRTMAARLRGGPFFDVCLFTLEGGVLWVQGVYVNARFLDDDEATTIVSTTAWEAIRHRREEELRVLYPDDADAVIARFRQDQWVRWLVDLDNLVVLDPPVRVRPPRTPDRFSNALDWSKKAWWKWLKLPDDPTPEDDDLPSTIEGRTIVVTHRARERDPGFIAKVKARRLAAHGHLACECCGLDLARLYGSELRGFIEGHHTRPVGTLSPKGEKITAADIALLCPTCHRVAHRTGRLALDELRALLPSGWTSPHPASEGGA